MSENLQLVFIDDDRAVHAASAEALELAGFEVVCFDSAEKAVRYLTPGFRGIVISDVRMEGMDGLALLQHVKTLAPEIPVVLITGHGDVSMAVQAMQAGAYDFIEKPCPAELLIDVARRAMETCRLRVEVESLRREVAMLHGAEATLLGCSPAIQKLRLQINNLADTSADVLLIGETGTGKELAARCLHTLSARRNGQFVAVNCGGLPESLFESEIFGHEAGAFTGAAKRRVGKVEYADGGTLFLDEIESMPYAFQTKMLRVLQERRVERLGSNQELPVDFRLVAATKNDLRVMSEQGEFRSDLYYRLNVAAIRLPPLRERREDIPLLLAHFTSQSSQRHNRPVPQVSTARMRSLMLHHWPGNVRELRNVAERLVLGLLDPLGDDHPDTANQDDFSPTSLVEQVDQFERALLQQELQRHKGCAQAAMQALRLPKRTFYDKMHKHGIKPEAFRNAH